MTGDQRIAKWTISSHQVSGWINVFALPFRSFEAFGIKGDHVRSQIDRKPNPVPKPPRPPGWKVRLKGMALKQIQALTFDDYQLRGQGIVRGSLEFQVRGEVNLEHLEAAFQEALLTQNTNTIAILREVKASGGMKPFALGSVSKNHLMDLLTAAVHLNADVTSLRFLDPFLARSPWLKLSGGGTLLGDIKVVEGILGQGSKLELLRGDLQAQYLESVALGDASLALEVSPNSKDPQLILTATISPFQILGVEGEPYLFGNNFQLKATSQNLHLSKPFDDLIAVVDIPESRIPDIMEYNAYFPKNATFAVTSGSGRLAGKFHFETQSKKGTAFIDIWGDQVSATMDQNPLTGDFHLNAQLETKDLLAKNFSIAGSQLSLKNIHTSSDPEEKPWFGEMVVESGQILLQRPLSVNAEMRLALRNSAPFVAIMARKKRVVDWASDFLTVQNLIGTGRLRFASDTIAIQPFEIQGEKVEILGQLQFRQHTAHGQMFIRFRGINLGIDIQKGERDYKLLRPRKWYQAQIKPPE